ncbi:hypothetical protein GCM10010353_72960 [Streptomyces chryseus]|nr:hypothetical protein GCM10010353_72960 [Streptomyces chryseus]
MQRLGRHRWVVERTVSWLPGCRRLHRRYERKPEQTLQRITTENTTLKQRVRQLTTDNRTLDERLKAARSNLRFQDRRIADIEAQIAAPAG